MVKKHRTSNTEHRITKKIPDAGCWILDTGCWMLDVWEWELGCERTLNIEHRTSNIEAPIPLTEGVRGRNRVYRTLNAEHRIPNNEEDTGYWMLEVWARDLSVEKNRTPNIEHRTPNIEEDAGYWMLHGKEPEEENV